MFDISVVEKLILFVEENNTGIMAERCLWYDDSVLHALMQWPTVSVLVVGALHKLLLFWW